ncbi:MAG: radical SAM protein [DPANN group archaeon]|nr:radical SAM protein [DPANN group archaeon]
MGMLANLAYDVRKYYQSKKYSKIKKLTTFTIVSGSRACQAKCPFCVSKMTPPSGVGFKEPDVDWRSFDEAMATALSYNAKTVLITSKGENTIFPDQVTKYLKRLDTAPYKFYWKRELQSNGIGIWKNTKNVRDYLPIWRDLHLRTIAISVVGIDPEKNREIYTPKDKEYIDLVGLLDLLKKHDFKTRLSVIMAKGYVDSVEGAQEMIDFTRKHKVDQLTLTPVNKADDPGKGDKNRESLDDAFYDEARKVQQWTIEHVLDKSTLRDIARHVEKRGKLLDTLPHGAEVFDIKGQNVALSNCLTLQPKGDAIRQLIFINGDIRYDWQYEGATF